MTEVRQETLQAALAGLLHDIGKFAQRAGYAGKHAEVGANVVNQLVPAQWRGFLYPVQGHHDKPLTGKLTKVVALADRLSAGERADETTEQPRQLLSIFCRLTAGGKRCEHPAYLPLAELQLRREVLFPAAAMDRSQVLSAYRDLWQRASEAAQRMHEAHEPNGNLGVYLESMLLWLQQYAWCIPAAYYRSEPDISLYDHSRMTAALASVLYSWDETLLDQVLASPEASQQKTALLVGGDISGVQEFIYTITSQGAASALRGRSFYLQLLTEVLARYVLGELGLPVCNLIYQGGGAFYLLARADDHDDLQCIRRRITERLWQHHRGDLYLALADMQLAAADFYDGRISDRWDDLARQLREVKQHRFIELGDQMSSIFVPQEDGGNEEQQCAVCGREHPGTTVYNKKKDDDQQGVRKCPPCVSYENLGKDLRRAHYLQLRECEDVAKVAASAGNAPPGGWRDVLAAFGWEAGLFESVPGAGQRPGVTLALSDRALEQLYPGPHTAVGRRLLVNVTPLVTQTDLAQFSDEFEGDQEVEVGDVKPFSLLEAQSLGIKRLGVLRMDLDDGGRLFSDGFVEVGKDGKERRFATLSRVAALSFVISLYFEGWVECVAEEMNAGPQPDTLYSIYSGGDDLFFVGAWDQVIELARRVRADLTPFAAGHPGIHASAGVALVGGKYPLYQAAEDAGTAEKEAKGYERRSDGRVVVSKDAVHFLGQTIHWQQFGLSDPVEQSVSSVRDLAELLWWLTKEEHESGHGVPAALLRILMRAQEQHDEVSDRRRRAGQDRNQLGEEQALWGPWMWRTHYALKRMAHRYKDRPAVKERLDELAGTLKEQDFRAIEWMGLAARWVDLWSR
jgi:CRISPR-associated protein Csm1